MSTPNPRAARVDRLPIVLLVAMTFMTVAGPFGVKWSLMGGERTSWPPDRAVEWVVLLVTCGIVFALMATLLGLGLANLKAMNAEAAAAKADPKDAP